MKRVAVLLVLALVLVSTAGAASTADPGVSAKRILLGGTVPLSGEASAFGSVGPGAKAYFGSANRAPVALTSNSVRVVIPARPR